MVGDVGDDAGDAGIDDAFPVGWPVGRPAPDGDLAAAGAGDEVAGDGAMLDGDGLGVPLEQTAQQALDSVAGDGRRDDGGRDARLCLAGMGDDVGGEGVDGCPGFGAPPADEADDGFDGAGIVFGVAGGCFEFAHDGEAAIDKVEHLLEGGDGFTVSGVGGLEGREGEVAYAAGEVGCAVDGFVVHEDGDAVSAELYVDLHGLGACIEAGADSGERIGRRLAGCPGVADDEDKGFFHGAYLYFEGHYWQSGGIGVAFTVS